MHQNIGATEFEFNPTTLWCLENCYLSSEQQRADYNALMADDKMLLPAAAQQYYWFKAVPEWLRSTINREDRCIVKFDISMTDEPQTATEDSLVFSSNTYTLFDGIYDNCPYQQVVRDYKNISTTTKFQYIVWLYCLTGSERQLFISNQRKQEGVIKISVIPTQ